VCWGHVTGVTQDNTETLSGNWTGGTISSSGDTETLSLAVSAQSTSDSWNMGAGVATITTNVYRSGDAPTTVEYRTGATQGACEAAGWSVYNGTSFNSLGWVQIRLTG
jgi:hypothetical protein